MSSFPDIKQQITFLGTLDLAGSSRFYGEVIGLKMVLEQKECKVFRVTSNSFLGICQRTELLKDKGRIVVISMVTNDVDAWHEYLIARGVQIYQEPAINEDYQIYNFFIKDPDGYLVEFQTFLHLFE
jgi:catechol 2,3-dioxygenase-like lactoylglutathione lyase family enzyme